MYISYEKWEMFANLIFVKVTSFAKFAKISSREHFQVYGTQSAIFSHAIPFPYALKRERNPDLSTAL